MQLRAHPLTPKRPRPAPNLPRHFLGWVPFLWTQVLFTGRVREATALRRDALLWLAILPAIFLYPTLNFRLLEPDESRYAQIPAEMLAQNEWVVPTLQGEAYLDKPPLLYWLVQLSYRVFGVSDVAARIPPTLAVHLTILALYLVGRRSIGERPAFWGALLLSLSPGFVGMGRLLILDGLLCCLVTLSILFAFEAVRTERFRRGWWYAAAVACALGILCKGPIALILLAPPLVIWQRLTGEGVRVPRRHIFGFVGVLLALNLPWYVAIYQREPAFLYYFFVEHNLQRFLQPFDHLEPFWFYLPIALVGLLPGTALLRPLMRYLTTSEPKMSATRSPEMGFWLIAGGWCLFFFSLSGSKLPTYILPGFPALCLVFGCFYVHAKWDRARVTRIGLAAMVVLFLGVNYVGLPWYANHRSPMFDEERVREYCADPDVPVIAFPRHCNSIAFYLGRSDFESMRSKQSQSLIEALLEKPRTVVLFTHRHSYEALRPTLPPQLHITKHESFRHAEMGPLEKLAGDTPWGLCDLAVIERR